jgi:hypothetical protein
VSWQCIGAAKGDELAWRVADRLARLHVRLMVDANGQARPEFFRPDNIGHNHSYLGTVRGLLRFGLLSGQRPYVDAVTNLYRNSIWQRNIKPSCATTHDLGATRCRDPRRDKSCESASAADVAEIALCSSTPARSFGTQSACHGTAVIRSSIFRGAEQRQTRKPRRARSG